MKKVLSFVLVLSMILGSFGMAFAAPVASDVAGLDCEDAVNALTELGVIAGYKDGSFKPEKVVTRAEAATFIVKALGLADYAVEKSAFSDMAGHWADPFVAYAASMGFVKGNTDGTFAPDATVTSDQMITMLVQAVGYKADYLTGGYPGAFVNQAKTLGILDGVKSGAVGCSRADVAQMIFNTLPVQFVRYDKDGSLEGIIIGTRSDNMLNRLGVLVDADPFVVDQNDVDTAVINVAPYVGAYVEAYRNSDWNIIAVSEVKSTFLTGKLNDAKDTLTVDDVEYVLTLAAQSDIASSSPTTTTAAVEFENGETKNISVDADTTYTFAVNVTGKTIKAVYSVADWTATEADYFADADAEDIKEDAKLFNVDFYKNVDQEIDMNRFELVGADSLEAIEEDDVVYVYAGGNSGKVTKIVVGNEVVTGKITKVNSTDSKFTVNGKVYELGEKEIITTLPKAGDEVKLYLDGFGDIYDYEKVSGEANYAVVLEVADGKTGLNGEKALVKMFLADGTDKTFEIDKNIEGYTTVSGVNILVDESVLTSGAIVEYTTDKDGIVDSIATIADVTTTKAVSAKGTFNGKVIAKTATIFSYNGSDLTDEDNYSVAKYESVLGAESVNATYALDDDDQEIACMLIVDFTTEEEVFGLFNGWANIDGDYDYEVTMFINGADKTYNATKTAKDLAVANTSAGILYKLSFDSTGALKGATDAGAVEDCASTAAVIGSTTATAIDGRYLTTNNGATTYTLAEDVQIVKWDAENGVWAQGRARDLHGLTSGAINLYSINGEDAGIYDVVTVVK